MVSEDVGFDFRFDLDRVRFEAGYEEAEIGCGEWCGWVPEITR